jgi:hypothetical protein
MALIDPAASRMLHHSADLAGATAGFALEYLSKVPPGSGGPIATLIASTLKEMASRTLSKREQARVGAASAHAIDRISARLIAGHQLREGSGMTTGTRAPSSELFEAVVLKARDAYEERKVRHMGLLFANFAFTQNVSFETANLLIRLLDRLTYRQLCLLALVARLGSRDMEALRKPQHADADTEALKREEMDLHGTNLGTLGLLRGEGKWIDKLSTLGIVLHDLASLDQIPENDVSSIDQILSRLTVEFEAAQLDARA